MQVDMMPSEAVAHFGSVSAAAKAAGIKRQSMQGRLMREGRTSAKPHTYPTLTPDIPLPKEDLTVDDALERARRKFDQVHKAQTAAAWVPITVSDPLPIAMLNFGDPHLGDNACNIKLLEHHAKLCHETDGLFGCNIGDTTNNWPVNSRLAKKWADQESSRDTEMLLAKWFLLESGVDWLVWIYGNHDAWDRGNTVLAQMNTTGVFMQDWEARFVLRFPNGRDIKVHVSHDFKGNSQWNILHGPLKAAVMSSDADLLICGHKHDWGISQFEIAGRHRVPTIVRCRGYKWHDEYARVHGFQSSQSGAAVLTIFNPDAKDPAGRIMAFSDIEMGVEVLKAMRAAAAAKLDKNPKRAPARKPKAKKPTQRKAKSKRAPRRKPARKATKSANRAAKQKARRR